MMKRLLACLVSGVLLLSAVFAPLCVNAVAQSQSETQVPPPVVAQVTANMVVLQKTEGYAYSRGGNMWGSSHIFEGLRCDTEYTFYQMVEGRFDTVSEAVTIRTKAKAPCSISAEPPIVDWLSHDTVVLVDRQYYEYRINGGEWTDDPWFDGLEPGTEYVFEQRLEESDGELASEPSEPLIVTTTAPGKSVCTNHKQLMDYIRTNGVEAENGIVGMAYYMEDEYGAGYYFTLYEDSGIPYFDLYYDGAEATGLVFDLYFAPEPTLEYIVVNSWAGLVSEGNLVDEVESFKHVQRLDYTKNYKLNLSDSGAYLDAQMVSELADASMGMLFEFWDEVLYTNLGFGMKGLGFSSYDGYGEIYCDPYLSSHTGPQETRFQRDPDCRFTGSNGYQYCTVCHEVLGSNGEISPLGDHVYSDDCDADCNKCGKLRRVVHYYSYACATECDFCDATREDPLAHHKPNSQGICSICGEEARIPGDFNADAEVDIGDVGRFYAHVRGSQEITDEAVLAGADFNNDGEINIADVARLYAHVNGRNPL